MKWILIIAVLTINGYVEVETSSSFSSEQECKKLAKKITCSSAFYECHPTKEINAYCKRGLILRGGK